MKYIFHHNDPDGYFAAALFLYKFDWTDIKFIEMKHPDEPFHDGISKEDTVYILDYNPGSIENLEKLCRRSKMVIWIDHHVSSYNKFKDVKFDNLQYYYNENKCSTCEQVFNYLYLYSNDSYKQAGKLIELISDYDSWKHKHPESINAFYGVLSVVSPEEAFEYLKRDLSDILSTGKSIFDYIIYNATKLKGFSRTITRADRDYSVLVKNTHLKGAFLFTEEEKEKYDFVVLISFPENLTDLHASIYSTKYDCAEMVTYYNIGGGHKGASGFKCSINTFNLLFKEI